MFHFLSEVGSGHTNTVETVECSLLRSWTTTMNTSRPRSIQGLSSNMLATAQATRLYYCTLPSARLLQIEAHAHTHSLSGSFRRLRAVSLLVVKGHLHVLLQYNQFAKLRTRNKSCWVVFPTKQPFAGNPLRSHKHHSTSHKSRKKYEKTPFLKDAPYRDRTS